MLDYSRSFIEAQFPVSKISKESYKERKAVHAQTLTSLGKWWGRKPLILVRATLLGVLMPVSDNLAKDREIFLKILTMDEAGLWLRKTKNISIVDIYVLLNPVEKNKYFESTSSEKKPILKSTVGEKEKEYIQRLVFNRLSYDEKLTYCERAENIKLVDENAWAEINAHLETNAHSIEELTQQLGTKRYGHKPSVGDVFAGGGSIPFEASRIGVEAFASDLNPIASLLTWASLNIYSLDDKRNNELREFQEKVYQYVDEKITALGIESSFDGLRGENYLYCTEAICPECGYKIPLSSSWVVVNDFGILVKLVKNEVSKSFDMELIEGADEEAFRIAQEQITFKGYKMHCLSCGKETPIPSLRGDYDDGIEREFRYNTPNQLRKWKVSDFCNLEDDIYTERLFAIRYINNNGIRVYRCPDKHDYENEAKVKEYVADNIEEWQNSGYVSNAMIEKGWNTNQLVYEKGWMYWHQLYNPRQILILALLNEGIFRFAQSKEELVIGILGLNRVLDWSSKLSVWDNSRNQSVKNTFLNQALNTLFNYGTRGLMMVSSSWYIPLKSYQLTLGDVELKDARDVQNKCDIWITDPPYGDAVNYHELSELFISWDKGLMLKAFPEWYTDSKRVLAIQGVGQAFNQQMIDVYKNLRECMPDNGTQVVMFTHQDVKVWSELAMILWSSGLQVVSAWTIATETISGLKSGGNYVKGTVLLTLKKQTSNVIAFQDELYDEIKHEVKSIIDTMKAIDDKDDPDFTDGDYLLASYAASLKVLTAYKEIDGIDVPYWLSQPRDNIEVNPVEKLIEKAKSIANDYLTPNGFDNSHWTDLKKEEKFYIRGLELEMNQSYKISSYQELARGFGVTDYKDMFADFRANSARLKTPSEFKMAFLNNEGFGSTLTRHLLVAINETTKSQSTVEGRNYLRNAFADGNEYWYKKPLMQEILSFIAKLEYVTHLVHWKEHAYFAKLLREALKNEGV